MEPDEIALATYRVVGGHWKGLDVHRSPIAAPDRTLRQVKRSGRVRLDCSEKRRQVGVGDAPVTGNIELPELRPVSHGDRPDRLALVDEPERPELGNEPDLEGVGESILVTVHKAGLGRPVASPASGESETEPR